MRKTRNPLRDLTTEELLALPVSIPREAEIEFYEQLKKLCPDKSMNWRSDPPTIKQLNYLRHLGCEAVPTSKEQASRLIGQLLGRDGPEPKAENINDRIDRACRTTQSRLPHGNGLLLWAQGKRPSRDCSAV